MSDSEQPKMPQTTGAVPISAPLLTHEQRLKYTHELLQSVRHAEPMDPGFDPVTSTPEQLELHGLPPRPDAALAPEQLAKWEELVTELKGMELVTPTFKIIQRSERRPEATEWTTRNWAGAVISQSKFKLTESNWKVPQPAAGQGDKDVWYSSAYVGIDGCRSNSVLAGGTGHDFHKLNSVPDTYAWCEWYPACPFRLEEFFVKYGDRVRCTIRSGLPANGRVAWFSICNLSTSKRAAVKLSPPPDTVLMGDSAEWVVEGEDPEANFHSVEFRNCLAINTNNHWYNLASAKAVNSTCNDGTVCTATIENDTTLLVTYEGKLERRK